MIFTAVILDDTVRFPNKLELPTMFPVKVEKTLGPVRDPKNVELPTMLPVKVE